MRLVRVDQIEVEHLPTVHIPVVVPVVGHITDEIPLYVVDEAAHPLHDALLDERLNSEAGLSRTGPTHYLDIQVQGGRTYPSGSPLVQRKWKRADIRLPVLLGVPIPSKAPSPDARHHDNPEKVSMGVELCNRVQNCNRRRNAHGDFGQPIHVLVFLQEVKDDRIGEKEEEKRQAEDVNPVVITIF